MKTKSNIDMITNCKVRKLTSNNLDREKNKKK
jgi:hypothetical protein